MSIENSDAKRVGTPVLGDLKEKSPRNAVASFENRQNRAEEKVESFKENAHAPSKNRNMDHNVEKIASSEKEHQNDSVMNLQNQTADFTKLSFSMGSGADKFNDRSASRRDSKAESLEKKSEEKGSVMNFETQTLDLNKFSKNIGQKKESDKGMVPGF